MIFFKNSELVKKYSVSDKAIRNWIEASRAGKIDLELMSIRNRTYIINSPKNEYLINELVRKGKKFHNKRSHREITPTDEFYKLYDSAQIIDIANNLEKYGEIPSYYRYLGNGAKYWNEHLKRFYETGTTNMLQATTQLLMLEKGYFEPLISKHDSINVIDLGVGNGLGAKELLQYLFKTGKLKNYIGIDCSPHLLDITEKNINSWFNGKINVRKYIRDIAHERFADTIPSNSYNRDKSSVLNIILFLGGTIGNFREPSQVLRVIRDSMGRDDILITSDEYDNEGSRKYFGSANIESFDLVKIRNKVVLDLLSIDESCYEIKRVFDERLQAQIIEAELKVELAINFKISEFKKRITLPKGSNVILFWMWEWTAHELADLYERNGLSQLRTTKLRDHEFVLLVSQVNTSQLPLTRN